jgi:hypothetical protein
MSVSHCLSVRWFLFRCIIAFLQKRNAIQGFLKHSRLPQQPQPDAHATITAVSRLNKTTIVNERHMINVVNKQKIVGGARHIGG